MCRILLPLLAEQCAYQQSGYLLTLYRKISTNEDIPLNRDLAHPKIERLKSRKPPITTAETLAATDFNSTDVWNEEWASTGINSEMFYFETLPHVLNNCPTHFTKMTERHDAIQDRLLRGIGPVSHGISINKTVPGSGLSVRPDVVITDDINKNVLIIDVTCPFENRWNAFTEARLKKIRKYTGLAHHFRRLGYDCEIEPFVVGSLGSWDPMNERVIKKLNINRRFAKTMRCLMEADAIRHSRNIYVSHVGIRPPPS